MGDNPGAGGYRAAYSLPACDFDGYERLVVERRGPVCIAKFNDPKNLNAMSYRQMAEFNDFLTQIRTEPECRVIVLTGEGRSFCAGFNLDELSQDPPDGMGRVQRDFDVMQRICSDQVVNMRRCPQLIVGALNGYAVGGGLSLACACDLRVLGESFKMNAGYLTVGLTGTDMGGGFFLPKIVGYARAMEILTTGRRYGAAQLAEWGFASKVVPDSETVEQAVALAEQIIAATSPLGLRLTKESLQASLDGISFDAMVKLENRNQVLASATADGRGGVAAMRDRQPIAFDNH